MQNIILIMYKKCLIFEIILNFLILKRERKRGVGGGGEEKRIFCMHLQRSTTTDTSFMCRSPGCVSGICIFWAPVVSCTRRTWGSKWSIRTSRRIGRYKSSRHRSVIPACTSARSAPSRRCRSTIASTWSVSVACITYTSDPITWVAGLALLLLEFARLRGRGVIATSDRLLSRRKDRNLIIIINTLTHTNMNILRNKLLHNFKMR